jgi:hypothetical protein
MAKTAVYVALSILLFRLLNTRERDNDLVTRLRVAGAI